MVLLDRDVLTQIMKFITLTEDTYTVLQLLESITLILSYGKQL